MTDSIKPPGGPPAALPVAPKGTDGAEGRFRAELEGATAAEAKPAASGASGIVSATVAEIRAGTLTPEAAVARLLEHHLGAGPARALAPAARAELERILRSRLEDDPTLRALSADLGRAR